MLEKRVLIVSKRKNNKDEKGHFVGAFFVIYVLLGCGPFSEANQNTEQQSSMPTVSNSYEPSLDDIGFVELQFSAVTIDMQIPLGWFPNDGDMIKTASVKALDDLKTIKGYLQQLSFTGDLIELKDMQLANMDMLIQIYNAVFGHNNCHRLCFIRLPLAPPCCYCVALFVVNRTCEGKKRPEKRKLAAQR